MFILWTEVDCLLAASPFEYMPVPIVLRCTMQQIWKDGRMRSLGHQGVAACIAATGFAVLGGGP
jgi:hypothetical protein